MAWSYETTHHFTHNQLKFTNGSSFTMQENTKQKLDDWYALLTHWGRVCTVFASYIIHQNLKREGYWNDIHFENTINVMAKIMEIKYIEFIWQVASSCELHAPGRRISFWFGYEAMAHPVTYHSRLADIPLMIDRIQHTTEWLSNDVFSIMVAL